MVGRLEIGKNGEERNEWFTPLFQVSLMTACAKNALPVLFSFYKNPSVESTCSIICNMGNYICRQMAYR